MFALDRSLSFVEAAEQDVVAIFRSTSVAAVSPPGCGTQISEAFVCAVLEDEDIRVYVVLVESSRKKVSIFVQEKSLAVNTPYEERLHEALNFAESMGFTMENVNLDYGRALREVIVRSVRMIKPPQVAKKQAQGKPPLSKRGAEVTSVTHGEEKTVTGLFPLKESDSESSAIESVVTEKRAAERRETERLVLEKAKTEKLERERLEHDKTLAEKRAAEHAEAERQALEKAKMEKLERERLEREKTQAEKRVAEHAEAERQALETAEAERSERERLEKEKAEAEKRAAEQAELARHAREEVEAERAEREKLLKEKAEAEKRAAEHVEAVRVALERAEKERVERERLLKEKAETEKRAAEQLETERRAREKAETERLEQEKLLSEKVAAETLAAERAEAERVEREKILAENEAVEKNISEQMETARLAREKAEAERVECERLLLDVVETVKLAEEKSEVARLTLEKAGSERSLWEQTLLEKAAAENRAAEQIEVARRAWEKAEAERVGCENLLADKVEKERAAAEQSEAAQLALEQARMKRAEGERLLAEKAEIERRAGNLIDGARLAWEKNRKGSVKLVDMSSTAQNDSDMPAAERIEGARQPILEAEFEQDEGEQIVVEKDSCKKHAVAQALPPAPGSSQTCLVEQTADHVRCPGSFSSFKTVNDGESSFFDSRQSGHIGTFTIHTSCNHVKFNHEEEVKKLYRSLNKAHVTIEGFPPQSCSAYLCTIEENGSILVYLAFFLSDSKKTLVYLPEKQPETFADCDKVIDDGINFAETAGFMMDGVELGSREERAKILGKIPVFQRVS